MATSNPAGTEEMEVEQDPRGAEGEDPRPACERPRKRRRLDDKYKAFNEDEKVLLKKYDDLETKTRKIIEATYGKFTALTQGTMPEGINYLKKRLDTLKEKTSLDSICIGFLGPTGAGKSSLINAILGKELFLPVSCSSTCTSCTVHVTRSTSDFYEAKVHLLSDQEWKDEVKKCVAILSRIEDEDNDDNEVDTYDDSVQEASSTLCGIYGDGAEKKAYEDLLKMKMKVTLPPRRIIKIKEKESVAACSVLWIISDIERAQGEKVQGLLLDESIKACVGGKCTDIALVATKSDNLNLRAYNSTRGNREPPIQNKHDAILERNEDLKAKKEKSIKEKLKRRLPPDSEIINKPNLVYTVSANEFCEPEHLNQEETEIPKLREYIREIYLKEKKKVVSEYVADAYGIHQLAENFGSEERLVEQHFQESGVEAFVNSEVDTLMQNLERCFGELEQPLCDGVEYAKRSCKSRVNKFLTKENGYRGFHKTLKAVCLKNGVYVSKTFARIDFNEDLATPIYDKISGHFGNVFRTKRPTRQSLWLHLQAFKNEVKKKIDEIGKRHKLPESKTDTCTREMEVMLTKLKKKILRRKKAIYDTLPLSIQNDLKPHYEVASNVRGARSCDQMKMILRENIEREVRNNMFEKAKLKMKSHLLKLKEEIVTTLKKEVSIVLKLALLQQEQLAVMLPDIEKECRGMKHLYDETLRTTQ
ncbi:nuclear GTPase SLIP-GC isoform X2 [Tiliqua scincoides]|uniref:nuclear GTPase SLIP-GC isoform X2 n=1 Tax=Tiliqua scincoides TaxID=71010 RepID=UPI0034634B55